MLNVLHAKLLSTAGTRHFIIPFYFFSVSTLLALFFSFVSDWLVLTILTYDWSVPNTSTSDWFILLVLASDWLVILFASD